MRVVRSALAAAVVVAAAVIAGLIAYTLTAQRGAGSEAAAEARPAPAVTVRTTETPRPDFKPAPCACFAAATPANPQPGQIAEYHSGGVPAQARPAATATSVAARVLRTAYGYDTRTDHRPAAALSRAQSWLTSSYRKVAALPVPAAQWQRWSQHDARATVELRRLDHPGKAAHPTRTTLRYDVTVRLHGQHGYRDTVTHRVDLRLVHRHGHWKVDRIAPVH